MDLQESRFEELERQLATERSRVQDVRRDYATIVRSRFHALRMLWFSLKHLLGIASNDDVYAVWSPALVAGLGIAPRPSGTSGESALGSEERSLIERWQRRAEARGISGRPMVSVIVPAFNHRSVTVRCLASIAATWFDSLAVQFIVADDGSVDGTSDLIARLPGCDLVRTGKNEGFIAACNTAVGVARGKYLCFLNNDTEVKEGWLDHLVSTAEADAAIGIVGSKLLYPNGRLQEAGAIVWRDGSGWNYGRSEDPLDPRYNYMRDVDYVSGAAMLVRSDVFRAAGGFSEDLKPAYYEDVDLCFAARASGYRVVYQPRSEVVHHEGVTSGDAASGVKRFQEINRLKFREKWASALGSHLPNNYANVYAASRRSRPAETVLVIDSYVPLHDQEAGSARLFHIVGILRKLGYNVVFLPDNYAGMQPYTKELQQMGVEVLYHVDGGRTKDEALKATLPALDFAWISRPDLFHAYVPIVRQNTATKIVYDTVDLCHVRKRREAELNGTNDESWMEWQRLEMEAANKADATVVVIDDEKTALGRLGIANVEVIPTIHESFDRGSVAFDDRSGLLFIGNYNHPPNVDAVTWLCRQVMPIVWQANPKIALVLAGSNPSDAVAALQSERVRVTGYVNDVSSYFQNSRVFVAPLRFGAGMKGKIGQALSYALPVVTTPVGAEGLGLEDGTNVIISDPEPHAFADALLRLYGDRTLWERLSASSAAAVEPFTPDNVERRVAAFMRGLKADAALRP